MDTSSRNAEVKASPRKRRVSVKSTRVSRQSVGSVAMAARQRKVSQSSRKRSLHHLFLYDTEKYSDQAGVRKESRGISSVVSPSRRLSEAVARRPTFTKIESSTGRRSSEPYATNMFTTALNPKRFYSKQGLPRKTLGVRKFSTAEAMIITNERKLEALAQDELLASLNVVLPSQCLHLNSYQDHSSETDGAYITCIHEEVEDEKNEEQRLEKEKREEKRLHILEEILKTEHNYVSCLEIVNDVFKYPLEQRTIVSSKNLKLMFPSSLNDILSSHTTFMEDLDNRLKTSDSKAVVGDIFSQMTCVSTKLLDIYTRYVNSFPKSISTLTKYTRGSHKFRKFLEQCYSDPQVERLDLPSFLLSPVQRLPRYILLLTELLKYTEKEHPDKDLISATKTKIEAIITSLDNSIKISMETYTSSDTKKIFARHLSRRKKKISKSNSENESKTSAKHISSVREQDNSFLTLPDISFTTRSSSVVMSRKNKSPTSEKRPLSIASDSATHIISCDLKRNHKTSWRKSLGTKITQLFSNGDCSVNSDSSSRCNGISHGEYSLDSITP